MSDDSETVENSKKTLTADTTDDSCIAEFGRTSDDHCRPEFIYPVIEVKPEDLQDVKQESADYDDTDVLQCLLKVRI